MKEELTYYVVMESADSENPLPKVKVIDEKSTGAILNYIRFKACLQSFKGRNRNQRLWPSRSVKEGLKGELIVDYLTKAGGWPGENGHPVPATGTASMERILTIDPNNICHRIVALEWADNDTMLYGTIDTIDDIDGPGTKFARSILQGIEPAFSLRSVVPQKKNNDGTIDVVGVARIICYDRVFGPSHKEAYRDINVPLSNIVTKPQIQTVLESLSLSTIQSSEKVNRIIYDTDPVMESAKLDREGNVHIYTKKEGNLIIPTEIDIKKEIKKSIMGF